MSISISVVSDRRSASVMAATASFSRSGAWTVCCVGSENYGVTKLWHVKWPLEVATNVPKSTNGSRSFSPKKRVSNPFHFPKFIQESYPNISQPLDLPIKCLLHGILDRFLCHLRRMDDFSDLGLGKACWNEPVVDFFEIYPLGYTVMQIHLMQVYLADHLI